MFELVEYMR